MFKDECSSKITTKFIALKPKSYAFTIHGEDDELKKIKRCSETEGEERTDLPKL